jgi:hypothetical protein
MEFGVSWFKNKSEMTELNVPTFNLEVLVIV